MGGRIMALRRASIRFSGVMYGCILRCPLSISCYRSLIYVYLNIEDLSPERKVRMLLML